MLKKLLSYLASRDSRGGFTMIELLVVIAVIGVLAVAVLSTINPIEQINKGRDTRTRSDAAQLMNAIDRYYAIQEEFPWNTDNTDNGYAGVGLPADAFVYNAEGTANTGNAWMDILASTEEVKQTFITRLQSADGNNVYIAKPTGSSSTLYACFVPSSQALKLEAAKRCQDEAGTMNAIALTGATVEGVAVTDPCETNDGSPSDNNMICLP